MTSWTRAELASFAGRTIPDVMPDDLRLLFVGINPGLVSAATGLHFARRGNRFYPALRDAGLVDSIDPAEASARLSARGVGITNLVARASARADDLTAEELRAGRTRLEALVADREPRVVAVLGVTAYRQAFGELRAQAGRQPADLVKAQLWIAPNPSGLNAHATRESLAADYGQIAAAAGLRLQAFRS
ncbi:mismatch-specific DNA-glycosylase [Aeromicrobium piscarium]|nr:mismatch-specific DNA-glycosylase [Aeromicrobium piscarium]